MEDQLSPSLGQDLDLSAAHVEEKKKKKPFAFDLPFACKGLILSNEKAKGFLQTAFYGPVLFSHPNSIASNNQTPAFAV